jgi:hypothetical protein
MSPLLYLAPFGETFEEFFERDRKRFYSITRPYEALTFKQGLVFARSWLLSGDMTFICHAWPKDSPHAARLYKQLEGHASYGKWLQSKHFTCFREAIKDRGRGLDLGRVAWIDWMLPQLENET